MRVSSDSKRVMQDREVEPERSAGSHQSTKRDRILSAMALGSLVEFKIFLSWLADEVYSELLEDISDNFDCRGDFWIFNGSC